jgi:dynein heavy chain
MSSAQTKLQRTVLSMEDLRFVMDCLKELKTKDSGIDHEMSPVTDMYAMLSQYLADGSIDMVGYDGLSMGP